MGKITPGFKTILVFLTFLGFTNFILSYTNINLSEIVLHNVSGDKVVYSDNLSSADSASMEMEVKTSSATPADYKSSEAALLPPEVTVGQITPSSCLEINDGGITINVSGDAGFTYAWSSDEGFTSDLQNLTNIPAGIYQVIVTDANLESATVSGIEIPVEDNVNPVAIAQNITVQLDSSGSATITPAQIDNGSNDACGIANTVLDITSFDCSNIGANTVTLTVTDNNGNTSTDTANVTIEDNVDPVVIAQDITVQLDASGSATITPAQIDNGSNDACGIQNLTLSKTSFDCSNIGANTVTLTVTDNNGNTSTDTANVTVEDKEVPIAIAQDITVQLDASGSATITPGQVDKGSNDACGIASTVLDITLFDCTNIGANTVTLTVTDNNGNTSTDTANVTIEDKEVPVAIAQHITVQLDASGSATITPGQVDNGSNDACGIQNLTLSKTSFDCSNIGANTVTLTVTDNNGNTGSNTATVTVEDNVDPAAIAQDITVQLDVNGSATITPAQINNGSNDACGIASMVLDITSFDCSNIGANTVTLTVTDNNGNTSTDTANVTIEDSVDPVAIAQDITVQLDASGSATITAAQVDNGSNDACGIQNLTLSKTSFDCSNIGANTVTLTVTDNNGNTGSNTATVTVEDNVDPVAIAQDITVQLDANGSATITPGQIDNGSNDACGIANTVLDITSFDCSKIGANTVTLTVTDNNGNTSTDTATVTVEDNVDPVAIAQNITVQLDASGNAGITAAELDNGSNDACDIATMELDITSFSCTNIGPNIVTLTVTDNNGNTSTDTATVTVEDNVDPVAIAQDITVQLDANGSVSITAAQVDNGSTDACGIQNLSISKTSFDCSNVGPNPVILTVTDNNGNTGTATATVTVQDNINPTIIAPLDVIVDTDPDECTASNVDLRLPTTNDKCGVKQVTNDAPAIFPRGITTVTWTVTDNSDNTQTALQTVTVNDRQAPVIPVLPDLISQCPLTVIPATTTDNCDGIITGTTGITDLTFDTSGSVFWIFTDASGNETEPVEQKVFISDTGAPVPDVTTLPTLTINGCQISSISELTIPTATDDCEGIISGTLSENFQFPYSFYGTNTIEWLYIDSFGNESSQTQEITLIPVTINGGTLNGSYESSVFQEQIDITSCEEAISINLELTGEIGNIVHWEKFAINRGVWEVITATNKTHTATFATGELESTKYRVLVEVGSCQVYSSSFYVRALPPGAAPTVENLDPDNLYCLGETVNLVATSNYQATQDAIPSSTGDFNQGQLNTQDPDSWLVDDNPGGFTAGGDAKKAKNWSGTNDHMFGNIVYDSQDKKFAIAQGNFSDSKYTGSNPTTFQTPIMDFTDAELASLDFDQAYYFANGDLAIIEISEDGGATYSLLRDMHNPGDGVKAWYTGGTAASVDGSTPTHYNFDSDNTTIPLEAYLGKNNIRIRWSFSGTSDKSVWALDNIFVNKKVLVDTELEWTEGIGKPDEEPIETGQTQVPISFVPDVPGVHPYGGTALVNGCRTYGEEGTGLLDIAVSYPYAGEDIIYTSEECGRNTVQLNAFDNSLSANENALKGAYTPPADCRKCDAPGTQEKGIWSWERQDDATPTCVPGSFSDEGDPNATFTAGPGTYTLTWTLESGCSDIVIVKITDCEFIDFDGINDYVDFKDNYDLNGAFSLEVWVKPESITGTRTIFSKRDANYSGTANGYDLKVKDGTVSFNWNRSGIIASAHKITTNRWYHIAVTHTAAGEYRLYIDGILTPNSAVGGGSPVDNNYKAILGAMDVNGSDDPKHYFSGWMEELRIWKVALTKEQLHRMMNQRIKSDGSEVAGEIIPLNIPGLNWPSLIGYYRMDDIGCGNIYPYENVGAEGKLYNITTPQENTAPLPYTTSKDNFLWTDEGEAGPWTHWDVWDIPHANGVNGNPIEWNIVKTSNYVESGNKNIKVLGLIIEENELDILSTSGSHDETNSGHSIEVTHYLEIDGVLDLTGESQLLQPMGSIIANSTGYLERDQQGTANSFNYNYWSSPVSPAVGNVPYSIGEVMWDGTNSASPKSINFGPTHDYGYADYYTHNPGNGKRVSSYWLNIFHGEENKYADWHRVSKDDPINVGEGYTMKGTSGNAAILDPQNYTFRGIPNNGNIPGLSISGEQSYLIGNPYPSAIDANEFILDNLGSRNGGNNVFNGSLYFWSHFEGGNTHILKEYIGGYAVYNLAGGIRAFANDERIDHISYQGQGGKEPQRFIPVGQSFFINSVSVSEYLSSGVNTSYNPPAIHGGQIHFKNSQRVFQRENETHSVFHRPEVTSKTPTENTRDHNDTRQKIWLKFHSPTGYHREILVAADSNATEGFDLGYDAPMIEYNMEDMFWLMGSTELVIQGLPDFNEQRVIPLGLVIDKKESFTIKIEKLLNFDAKAPIYLRDKQNDSIHNLRTSEYVAISEPGYINERFELIFYKENPAIPVVDNPVVEPDEMMNEFGISLRHGHTTKELQVLNPKQHMINNLYIFDINNNKLEAHNELPRGKEFRMPVRNYSSGVYIVQMVVEGRVVSKKIIINN